MTTSQDCSIGLKKESVYGTAVTVDHFYEFTDENLDWAPDFGASKMLRYGKTILGADRRVLTKDMAEGDFTIEPLTKGLGALFEAALGSATSTLVAGSAYQVVATPAVNSPLPSYTIQKGIPPVGGGTVNAHTFTGCVCDGFELKASGNSIPTVKFSWNAQSVQTGVAYAATSYPAGTQLFSFVNAAITVGGTVTVPTATAIATGGTAATNVRDFSFSWKNDLDKEGFNYGNAAKRGRAPIPLGRNGSGSISFEYTDNTIRDAYLAQGNLAIVLTFTGTTAISGSDYPTFQLVLPCVRLDGELPKANNGEAVTVTSKFTLLDARVAASPLYVVVKTAETAI